METTRWIKPNRSNLFDQTWLIVTDGWGLTYRTKRTKPEPSDSTNRTKKKKEVRLNELDPASIIDRLNAMNLITD